MQVTYTSKIDPGLYRINEVPYIDPKSKYWDKEHESRLIPYQNMIREVREWWSTQPFEFHPEARLYVSIEMRYNKGTYDLDGAEKRAIDGFFMGIGVDDNRVDTKFADRGPTDNPGYTITVFTKDHHDPVPVVPSDPNVDWEIRVGSPYYPIGRSE